MPVLNPIKIDRFTLYLDRVVAIRVLEKDIDWMEAVFSDRSTMLFHRSIWNDDIYAQFPKTFVRFDLNNLWVNDNFIHYSEKIWSTRQHKYILRTKVEVLGLLDEYIPNNLDEVYDQRLVTAIASLIPEPQEVQSEVVKTVEETATTIIRETLNDIPLQSMDQIFISALNA